jgi:hypothetical protein
MHAAVNPNPLPWSWKVMLSGYVPKDAHDSAGWAGSVPFPEELQPRSWVNKRAQAAGPATDFSQRIRQVGTP